MKVQCRLCERKIPDTWADKWRHMLKYHPEETFSRLLPLALDPSKARDIGIQAGRLLRQRIESELCRGVK